MPCSPKDITLEHIDPLQHPLISGLKNDFNEVMALGSHNYSKRNRFVPYRGEAPINFGDAAEFLIKGEWMITNFGGDWWTMEAVRLLQVYGVHGGPKPVDWETRIKEKEELLDIHVIVSSPNGGLTKNSLAVKFCNHGRSKPRPLWQVINPTGSCCKAGRTRNSKGHYA